MSRKKQYQEFLATKKWQEMRRRRIDYDCHTCQHCGESGRPGNELTVHHVNYDRFGGEEWMSDLLTVCKGCHARAEEMKGFSA